MTITGQVTGGWGLLVESLRVLYKKPIILVPIFVSWMFVSALVLYLRYFPPATMALLTVFLSLFAITLIISLANIVMLEFMQQIESGEKISFLKALKEAVLLDFLKVIPIAAVWALIWLIILLLRCGKRLESERPEPSLKDAAMTLGGDRPFSWWQLGLDLIEKLVRMFVFLSLPAIAWENKGPIAALRTASQIIKKHPIIFLSTYTLTEIVAAVIAIPLIIVFSLAHGGVSFSPWFWTLVLIYISLVWTTGIYLEQMSVGLLYLWHLKWVKNRMKGELSSVQRPSLLDDTYELKM